jgi:aspartyl-tRNA(Asn)/glutamyl-tRNA(Gln) amidotransferase subunit B
MNYIADIGLEVHVQLKTKSKLFCSCSTEFGAPPNSHICPVCLGYPGVLPVLNEEAVRLVILTGLMMGAKINQRCKFDRKSYFYPDMPKNYQISQYDMPLCTGGAVEFTVDNAVKTVRLVRIHLEEDVGKNLHFQSVSGIDFNRAGVPLMEIVTEPDMHSHEDAYAFLTALKQILQYIGVSDCNQEQGNIRCDVNCSIRREDSTTLGVKTEIKNLNTFKGVYKALEYELARQRRIVESGGKIIQETRRWDPDAGITVEMRSKEFAHDYRYFPEPDLCPVVISSETIESLRKTLPEHPEQRRKRLIQQYGLPEYDAGVISAERMIADFFEETVRYSVNPKLASNWIMTDVLRKQTETRKSVKESCVTPQKLAELIRLQEQGTVSSSAAKQIFEAMWNQDKSPSLLLQEMGLTQVSDMQALEALADMIIRANAKSVADYKAGKKSALKHLIGCAMRESKGKANPRILTEIFEKKLGQ